MICRSKPEYTETKDGRVILRGHLYQRMRWTLCKLANDHCEQCGQYTPVSDGEAHHRLGRGAGKRDDRIYVEGKRRLSWFCKPCHRGKHVPAKVVPKKQLSDEEFRALMGL